MRIVTRSQIADTFDGFGSDKVWKFTNGEIWEQARYAYHYHYAYRPNVTIRAVSGHYEIEVQGCGPTVEVRRVR